MASREHAFPARIPATSGHPQSPITTWFSDASAVSPSGSKHAARIPPSMPGVHAGLRPVVVHGGGPQITEHLDRLGGPSSSKAPFPVAGAAAAAPAAPVSTKPPMPAPVAAQRSA